jgi:hypothetical protein
LNIQRFTTGWEDIMAFTNYKSIADVLKNFSLNYQERNFVDNTEFKCDEYFASRLNVVIQEGIVFNSEYAICENIISPILTEIWRGYIQNFLIWSHQPLNYDDNLSGVPDYVVAQRSPRGKVVLEKPYMIVVEAKKDNFEEGWGQCLAEMLAAQKLNNDINKRLFGMVSNGKLWEFGVLQEEIFTKNRKYYVLDNLEELMGAVNFLFAESAAQL